MEDVVVQKFPFKTVSMLASFLGNVAVSYLAKYLFESGKISHKYDFLDAVVWRPSKPRLSVTLAAAFKRRDTLAAETVEEEDESSPDSSHHDE
ncbi:hypothetical protein KUCAC02_002760 [Chaenocephalus aceratus]|uniref:Uncharacterized protein n=1 Tax=Chaenocephalus aceratus TaxID=36190 RepID=A0ACB9XWT1_CHAAC|nr:hypothetical protein KUCAC02_002760 [Chaenocephalus aceratus]